MKKIIVALLFATFAKVTAQEVVNDSIKAPISIDSLKQSIDDHTMRLGSFDERLAAVEGELSKLTKIKLSGYVQAQYDNYEYQKDLTPVSTSNENQPVRSTFFIRRARIKFTYEGIEGVKLVIQPDFAFDKVTLRDCYAVLNDRWLNTFSLTAGQFNRLSYEVEFSSNTREFLERTRVTNHLYPTERDLGIKLEANFYTKFGIPLKFQAAVLNGNFATGELSNQLRDIDNQKDFMLRAVYSFKFQNAGLGVDLGGHGYFGKLKVMPTTTPALATFSDLDNMDIKPDVGTPLPKSWFGLETQIYYDFLGGMSLKGEYLQGRDATSANPLQKYSVFGMPSANKVRDIKGWYVALTKNVGKKHQLAVRMDYFDPNTRLAGNEVTRMDDLSYTTFNLGWQYFFDEHVKVVLGYNIPINEKSDNIVAASAYSLNGFKLTPDMFKSDASDFLDNTFTIRLQAKF